MKLKDIYLQCKRYYSDIKDFRADYETSNGESHGSIRNIEKLESIEAASRVSCKDVNYNFSILYSKSTYQAAEQLINIEGLNRFAISFLEKLSKFPMDRRIKNVSKVEIKEILAEKNRLLVAMRSIIDLYESMGLDTDSTIGLDVKLPISNDFTDFKKNIDDLEFIFTKCPFFQHKNENLKFQNVDVGSAWLTFVIVGASITAGSVLLNNIAAFIDKCIIIRSHHITVKKQIRDLENENINQADKKVIRDYLVSTYIKTVDIAVKELEESTNHQITDGDERGRVDQAFERLERLLEKGIQLCASIDSPKETKALFEPLEIKYLEISKQLELLEDRQEGKSVDVNGIIGKTV